MTSENQASIFFGDLVGLECQKIHLVAGNTFDNPFLIDI